jgi:hypothetical protein
MCVIAAVCAALTGSTFASGGSRSVVQLMRIEQGDWCDDDDGDG